MIDALSGAISDFEEIKGAIKGITIVASSLWTAVFFECVYFYVCFLVEEKIYYICRRG